MLVTFSRWDFARSPLAVVRAVIITDEAPRFMKWMAVERPIPDVAPIIRIVFFVKVLGGGREGTQNLLW